MSTGQHTPGTNKLLKQIDCRSFVKSKSNWGQLLKSWHFPVPPSALVQLGDEESELALGSRSTRSAKLSTLLDDSIEYKPISGVTIGIVIGISVVVVDVVVEGVVVVVVVVVDVVVVVEVVVDTVTGTVDDEVDDVYKDDGEFPGL